MSDDHEEEHEHQAKRKKQQRRMTKILAKSWRLDGSDPFRVISFNDSSLCAPEGLSSMGQALDKGEYAQGKAGWESFAKDLGKIYNFFLVRKGKNSKLAKKHLESVKELLSQVDPRLGELASDSVPKLDELANSPVPKKRKNIEKIDDNIHIPKKKHAVRNGRALSRKASLTLSQREEIAMRELETYLEECGGEKEQAQNFRCQVMQHGEKSNFTFINVQGRRLKSMAEVAKFLSLSPHEKSTTTSSVSTTQKRSNLRLPKKNRRPRNYRELDSERKKLRREMDKLLKAHGKSSKALDEFRNDNHEQLSSSYDDLFNAAGDGLSDNSIINVIQNPDIDSFPGLPPASTPDLLLVWDFLCTFHRTLSLEPIELDYFAEALALKNTSMTSNEDNFEPKSFPLYLAEAHLALLNLLLSDPSSDEWWWSTLETVETEALETGKTSENTRGEADNVLPTIKVDMSSLLAIDEDPGVTKRWLQALEDVRARRANAGGAIKSAVKSAISISTNPFVKTYLHKAMRKWKEKSAGFTKQSVIWLIGKIREARPDLWGRKVSEEAVAEQKKKVAREASVSMEQLDDEPEIENAEDINYGESDEESESEDDENEADQDEDFEDNRQNASRRSKAKAVVVNDEQTPSTTPIPNKPPPPIVDLLLPPYKPLPKTDLVSPFTWPLLAGAVVCRISHHYKRIRNEVDDNLRNCRDLPPLYISERREREEKASSRLFSGCMSLKEKELKFPIDDAIQHLGVGGNYFELTALQKLCILRVLVEACYDSNHVYECLYRNINDRIGAIRQLENEERRAKKEARVDAAKVEAAARQRLAENSKHSFMLEKRKELKQISKNSSEFTEARLKNLTDEEVISKFDEDTQRDFDFLPTPQSFSKSDVNHMVAKINEENAFNTTALEVLTLEEIENREAYDLSAMEEELNSYGDPTKVYQLADRETSAKVDKLKKEIASYKDWQVTLPQTRAEAIDALKEAIEDGTIKALKSAIKSAKLALLIGDDEESGGLWALDLVRDASMELKTAESKKKVTELQKDLVVKRDKCFVRSEPLGKDKFYNKYWQFDYDGTRRVWSEADALVCKYVDNITENKYLIIDTVKMNLGSAEEEKDLVGNKLSKSIKDHDKFLQFSRQEYNSSGETIPMLRHYFGGHCTDFSLRGLVKSLDGRRQMEGKLKEALKGIIESSGLVESSSDKPDASTNHSLHHNSNDNISDEISISGIKIGDIQHNAQFKTAGDDDAFSNAKIKFENKDINASNDINMNILSGISSALGLRGRLRLMPDISEKHSNIKYLNGTITGWNTRKKVEQLDDKNVEVEIPVWRISLDKGGEKILDGSILCECLIRAENWKNTSEEYAERDLELFAYRNKLGRFCGRAIDAPQASTSFFLARLMIKREIEYYMALKSLTYENNWGGKSGARNSWIASMKEFGHQFSTIQNGLLTLENAFYECCEGISGEADYLNHLDGSNEEKSGRELLSDDCYRFEIELESIGPKVKGLWNSKETRLIFKEIITGSTTVGIIALGLDLLCRNCEAFLKATKPLNTRSSSEKGTNAYGRMTRSSFEQQPQLSSSGRRLNAWQKQHEYY